MLAAPSLGLVEDKTEAIVLVRAACRSGYVSAAWMIGSRHPEAAHGNRCCCGDTKACPLNFYLAPDGSAGDCSQPSEALGNVVVAWLLSSVLGGADPGRNSGMMLLC